MVACGVIGGPFSHIVDGNRTPGTAAHICAGTMPSERMMEVDMAFFDGANGDIERVLFKGIGHRTIAREIA